MPDDQLAARISLFGPGISKEALATVTSPAPAARFSVMRFMQIPLTVSGCGRRGFSPNCADAL
ncbi:hypothetical protein HNR60_003889 [Rhodopseudomonas rhenobacensis]|uniref:Uncharacterized protein n=1 Tax=Rhodopseudomonas rhenobacensis TaxID=87461 RepID=A0A7W8E0Q0_9BRAD|nr:hypothetical protein [Rhodopseudomonas rhenobacensis]MBB5049115.1 hypothetical protein [Rhodopseudomonas rhenobacensis]